MRIREASARGAVPFWIAAMASEAEDEAAGARNIRSMKYSAGKPAAFVALPVAESAAP